MNPDDVKHTPERNELVAAHMAAALVQLTLAYNSARSANQNGDAWGIALAIAETASQAVSLGVIRSA